MQNMSKNRVDKIKTWFNRLSSKLEKCGIDVSELRDVIEAAGDIDRLSFMHVKELVKQQREVINYLRETHSELIVDLDDWDVLKLTGGTCGTAKKRGGDGVMSAKDQKNLNALQKLILAVLDQIIEEEKERKGGVGMTNLESVFGNFVMDRTDEAGKNTLEDKECRQLQGTATELRREIIKHLPPELLNLLNDYDSSNNLLCAIEAGYAYRQGLRDGMELKQILGLVS